jgi:recombination protein RecR
MRNILPKTIENLTEQFSRLPGIGSKTASRLAFSLLQKPENYIKELGAAVLGLKENLHSCKSCFLITDEENECVVCQDLTRDQSLLCVTEDVLDVIALESSGSFKGYYHVLGGVISPIDGIGPDQLRIKELLHRIKNNNQLKEVIMATNPSLEGEATALYLSDQLRHLPISITRIARGLPNGSDLEYADEVTLQRALEGRQKIKED